MPKAPSYAERSKKSTSWYVPPWWYFSASGDFVTVTNQIGSSYVFRLQTGELYRQYTKASSLDGPTPEEMAAFEAALAGGGEVDPEPEPAPPAPVEAATKKPDAPWLSALPEGASVHTSLNQNVRVVRIAKTFASGPKTSCYDAKGNLLWEYDDYLPEPFFLQPLGISVGDRWVGAPLTGRTPHPVPLLVSYDGKAAAVVRDLTTSNPVVQVEIIRADGGHIRSITPMRIDPKDVRSRRVVAAAFETFAIEFEAADGRTERVEISFARDDVKRTLLPPTRAEPSWSDRALVTVRKYSLFLGFLAGALMVFSAWGFASWRKHRLDASRMRAKVTE
ncbi:MAG: hypothetical protein KDB82_17525 [Planctomycetes bacterium]|nr:hypothetical protein [Planctomycetota bacterium]